MLNFQEIALDTTGIHPAAVTTLDKNYKEISSVPRSKWKDGWNACIMDITSRATHLENWFTKLPDRQQEAIEFFKNYGLSFDFPYENEKETDEDLKRKYLDPIITLNCSDTFLWGCSDSEEITPDELVELQRASRWILSDGDTLHHELSWLPTAYASFKRDNLKLMDELKSEQETVDKLIEIIKTRTTIKK